MTSILSSNTTRVKKSFDDNKTTCSCVSLGFLHLNSFDIHKALLEFNISDELYVVGSFIDPRMSNNNQNTNTVENIMICTNILTVCKGENDPEYRFSNNLQFRHEDIDRVSSPFKENTLVNIVIDLIGVKIVNYIKNLLLKEDLIV